MTAFEPGLDVKACFPPPSERYRHLLVDAILGVCARAGLQPNAYPGLALDDLVKTYDTARTEVIEMLYKELNDAIARFPGPRVVTEETPGEKVMDWHP